MAMGEYMVLNFMLFVINLAVVEYFKSICWNTNILLFFILTDLGLLQCPHTQGPNKIHAGDSFRPPGACRTGWGEYQPGHG